MFPLVDEYRNLKTLLGTQNRQMCAKCDEFSYEDGYTNVLNFPRSSSHLSNVSTMSEGSKHGIVYRRKKRQWKKVLVLKSSDNGVDCPSLISSGKGSQLDHRHDNIGNSFKSLLVYDRRNRVSNLGRNEHGNEIPRRAVNSLLVYGRRNHISKQGLDGGLMNNKAQRNLEVDSVNDSCSSSKSNMERVLNTKAEVDDTGECSSSSVRTIEEMGENLSGKDLCIFILKSHGLLSGVFPSSNEELGARSCNSSFTRHCKTCGNKGSVTKMLICDHCEESFHVSCCNPRMKNLPIDDWFCDDCLSKRHKILTEICNQHLGSITDYIGRGKGRNGFNSIAAMLKETEPYRSSVRVGKGFQADIPDWSGPLNNDDDADAIGEPLEMDPSEFLCVNEQSFNNCPRVSSIGNWLQCQAVIDDAGEGVICGKWRRAPIFEAQTDEWECFCSVLWDPTQADCAVPQELETEQVLKQLKYIEMLRPQLVAKRRKNGPNQA